MHASAKKTKQESTSPVARPAFFNQEREASMSQAVAVEVNDVAAMGYTTASKLPTREGMVAVGQASYASPPVFQSDSVEGLEVKSVSVSSSKPTASLVSPPTSLADEVDVMPEGDAVASVEGDPSTALHTPNSSSRQSSRQPRHVEGYAPEASTARASKPARAPPGPPTSSRKPSSRPSSSHAKKSSPMVEKRFDRHASASSISPRQSKHAKQHHHLDDHDPDVDEESLRLIRELQEQDFGLRRRSTRP